MKSIRELNETSSDQPKFQTADPEVQRLYQNLQIMESRGNITSDTIELCENWITLTMRMLKGIALKPTLEQKKETVQYLEFLLSGIQSRELIINFLVNTPTSTDQAVLLESHYQDLMEHVKDIVCCWRQYVAYHEEFIEFNEKYLKWMITLSNKLDLYECVKETSRDIPDWTENTSKDLSDDKDEGYSIVKGFTNLGEIVLKSTEITGREVLTGILDNLLAQWSNLVTKMDKMGEPSPTKLSESLNVEDLCDHIIHFIEVSFRYLGYVTDEEMKDYCHVDKFRAIQRQSGHWLKTIEDLTNSNQLPSGDQARMEKSHNLEKAKEQLLQLFNKSENIIFPFQTYNTLK